MSTSSSPPPPTPIHHIRTHTHPVTALSVSKDNERIYSADASGRVVATSSRSLRPLAVWDAHTDSILGIEEVGVRVFTHGRDNKLHIWRRPARGVPIQVGTSATAPGLSAPERIDSIDVNALNYCRFSILSASQSGSSEADDGELWLAVPNLAESACADIWQLPGKERLHAAIGKPEPFKPMPMDGRGGGVRNATGIIMSMHLLPHLTEDSPRLLVSYESGAVKLWTYDPERNEGRVASIESIGWSCTWEAKVHVESVMGMTVSPDYSFALSVSADHLVGKYEFAELDTPQNELEPFRTKHPGNGAIALRTDGRVCAIGGWDGKVRLYSTKTFKPLGTLVHHKSAIQALCFARTSISLMAARSSREDEDEDEDEEGFILTATERQARGRWLVSADKDGRVAIWKLIDFERSKN